MHELIKIITQFNCFGIFWIQHFLPHLVNLNQKQSDIQNNLFVSISLIVLNSANIFDSYN